MAVVLDKISKKVGGRTLFDEVSATFSPNNRYGLTGPNGAGKSTLLKIMMGENEATSGKVSIPKRTGFLRQNIADYLDKKVIESVIMGNPRLSAALEERDRLYLEEITDEVGIRLGELEEIIADEDGYTAEADAEVLLEGMGLDSSCFESQLRDLPSDHQFRVLLCQALFGSPEALLLDEPTNHLDLDSIKWLEDFLHQYSGTLIVVSHDRHFLNTVTTHIADIDYDTIITYPGNYDEMIVAKSSVRARAEEENKSKEKKVAQLKEFVSKFGAGTRASQVQSRVREINRLQPQDLKKSNIQRPYIRFQKPAIAPGQIVYKIEELNKSFDSLHVVKNFSLEIHRGDKIGVIGKNGLGKTTLLKLIAGLYTPDSGSIVLGNNLDMGYFPQEHADAIDKSEKISMFDWLRARNQEVYDQDIRGSLGKLLFGGDDAFKEINKLSGGETARLILANMMLKQENVLILDEPNNHLDLESVSALGWGLDEYPGTTIVASHDRDLIGTFAKKIIAFEEDGIHYFDGTVEEYLSRRVTAK